MNKGRILLNKPRIFATVGVVQNKENCTVLGRLSSLRTYLLYSGYEEYWIRRYYYEN